MSLAPAAATYLVDRANYNPNARKAVKFGIVGGSIGTGLAVGGYLKHKREVKAAKEEKLKRQKSYSEKPSESKNAFNHIKGVASVGSAIGVLGYKNKNLKKAGEIAMRATTQSKEILGRIEKAVGEIEKRGFKDQKAKEAFDTVLKKADHYIKTNTKGSKRALKVAAKMDAKGLLKRGAKGAAIGTGVGTLTYGVGKLIDKKKRKMKKSKYTTHLDRKNEKGGFIQPYNPETGETGKRIHPTQQNYSEKEEYLNGGKETEHQKTERRTLTGGLVSLGTGVGTLIGMATTKQKNTDRAHKIAKNINEDSKKVLDFATGILDKFHKKGNRFKDPQTKEAFENALKWGENRINTNSKNINRVYKVARAMDNKATVKRGLKGAAISAAITTPLAYAANKSMKNENEKINRSRRGSKTEKKISQRNYGKIWEGVKGGTKGAISGAKWGAILAPGNLTAAAFGKKKLALGLTGAGAAVGAYIGGKNGYENAVESWKYKNDPEYAKKVDKENKKTFDENCKTSKKVSYSLASDFKLNDWIKFSAKHNLPKEILKYIKFYNSWWKNNIDDWYDNLIYSGDIFCPEFHNYFPSPIDAKMSDEWMDDSYGEVAFLTFNQAGDDGWGCYNLDTNLYGIDIANDTKSLKDLLTKNLDRNMKSDINSLSPKNIKIIQDFKRHL